MSSFPKLSLIVPMYNAGAHFTALKQNIGPGLNNAAIEIILVNDGSKDNTLELAQQLAREFQNILVLDKANGGAASARNAGIKQASGTYLAFLDADDRMDFGKLFPLLEMAGEKQLDLCAFDLRHINTDGKVSGNGLQHPVDYNTLQSGQFFLTQGYQPSSICVFLVRTAFITGHNLFFHEGITHEDVELSFRWMLKAQKAWFTKEVVYFYYQNPGSVTNQLTPEKKKTYLLDEVIVAALMKAEENRYNGPLKKVIQKNYNSVTWNLLYSIYIEPGQLDKSFVTAVLQQLKARQLYPIKGALKTKFQSALRILMNIQPLWKQLSRRKLS
ncbi:MAG: glycosyltransferase [Chryseobacterium sp.]|nr:MAG: glycosyltransferase [Chryseobacterium sp.]